MGGTVPQWSDARFQFTQDGVGSRTVSWPAGFQDLPTLQSGIGQRTSTTFECITIGGCSNGTGIWQNTDVSPTGVGGSVPASPTSPNGVPQSLTSTPAGGVGQTPVWSLSGITGRAVTGATSTDTIVTTDCNNDVDYQTSVSISSITIPTATTLAVPGCVLKLRNDTTGTNTSLTLSPTTWNIKIGANSFTSVVLAQGQSIKLTVDAAGGLWDAEIYSRSSQTDAYVTAAVTNSTTTLANVTGLTFPLLASTTYTLSCKLIYQAAATGGLHMAFTGPAAPTAVDYSLTEWISATAGSVSSAVGSTFATDLGGTITTAATNFPALLDGGMVNGANGGTLQVQFHSAAAVATTIEPGSFCTLRQVN
jgi:hypothetical protein